MYNKYSNVQDINIQDILDIYGFNLINKELIYGKSISEWSWGATLIIWKDKNKFYAVDEPDNWNIREVSEDEALQMILDFEV